MVLMQSTANETEWMNELIKIICWSQLIVFMQFCFVLFLWAVQYRVLEMNALLVSKVINAFLIHVPSFPSSNSFGVLDARAWSGVGLSSILQGEGSLYYLRPSASET